MDEYELADKLYQMYDNAKRNEAVCQVILFGILYAQEIKEESHVLKRIVELSGIRKGYLSEISKGMQLAKYVVPKDQV